MLPNRKTRALATSKTVTLSNHPLPVSKFARGHTNDDAKNADLMSGEESNTFRLGLIDESVMENLASERPDGKEPSDAMNIAGISEMHGGSQLQTPNLSLGGLEP